MGKIKKSQKPDGKCYNTVVSSVNDKFVILKPNFFIFVANNIQPFLTKYQSSEPLIPFLYDDIKNLLIDLMTLVYKESFITEYIHNLDDSNEANFNKSTYFKRQVDIGCAANQLLQEKRNRDEIAINKYYKECRLFIVSLLEKLKNRMLVGIKMLKTASALNQKTFC